MLQITRNQLKIALEKGNTEAVRQIFEELQETTLKQMVVDLLPRFNAIVSSHSEGTCEDQSMDTVDSEEGVSLPFLLTVVLCRMFTTMCTRM